MTEAVVRRVTAWSVAVSGVGAVLWAAVGPVITVQASSAPRLSTPSQAVPRLYPTDSLGRVTVARDLFRSTRRPAALAYDPQRAAAPADVAQPPKPALVLVGLVAGGEATAVIEGIPGIEGSRVMRVGDIVSGLRLERIEADRVVIVGMDTTWVLKVREPWR